MLLGIDPGLDRRRSRSAIHFQPRYALTVSNGKNATATLATNVTLVIHQATLELAARAQISAPSAIDNNIAHIEMINVIGFMFCIEVKLSKLGEQRRLRIDLRLGRF